MSVTCGMTAAGHLGEADMSEDGAYRYVLNRRWDRSLPVLCWIMLNPSVADAVTDDPTITRCIRRAERWRWRGTAFGGICVLNLFALRATDPAELSAPGVDPVGPENNKWLSGIDADTGSGRRSPVIAAWGSLGALRERDAEVCRILAGTELWCLGTTASGQPRHPGRLGYDVQLVPYQ